MPNAAAFGLVNPCFTDIAATGQFPPEVLKGMHAAYTGRPTNLEALMTGAPRVG
jgi:hypothetical protein